MFFLLLGGVGAPWVVVLQVNFAPKFAIQTARQRPEIGNQLGAEIGPGTKIGKKITEK